MAAIIVNIPDIPGESTLKDYEDMCEALAMRDTIEVPVARSSGSQSASRTAGTARHSDVQLTRVKDRASPKLAEACSAGKNLGEVAIYFFRTIETGAVAYMRFTLVETFVSRIEWSTLDETGAAYQPHFVSTGDVSPPTSLGVVSVVGPLARGSSTKVRLAPRAMVGNGEGADRNTEIERLWLNPAQVLWTYTGYEQGASAGQIAKGWDFARGVEASVA